ncbi:hypothetical protein HOY80DRAFT_21484 [Tuber brumale]|nr:hypothetical protein HOY80DRAFT_21484 [Tuber brumale]
MVGKYGAGMNTVERIFFEAPGYRSEPPAASCLSHCSSLILTVAQYRIYPFSCPSLPVRQPASSPSSPPLLPFYIISSALLNVHSFSLLVPPLCHCSLSNTARVHPLLAHSQSHTPTTEPGREKRAKKCEWQPRPVIRYDNCTLTFLVNGVRWLPPPPTPAPSPASMTPFSSISLR